MERKTIALPLGQELILIIGCLTKYKPKDIPYGLAIGSRLDSYNTSLIFDDIDFFNAKISAVSLLSVASVTSVQTRQMGRFCLAVMKAVVCRSTNPAVGFNCWNSTNYNYERFIMMLLEDTYKVTSFRQKKQTGVFELRPEKRSDVCNTEIIFEII